MRLTENHGPLKFCRRCRIFLPRADFEGRGKICEACREEKRTLTPTALLQRRREIWTELNQIFERKGVVGMPCELTPQEYAVEVMRLPARVRQVLRKSWMHAGPEAEFGDDEALERIRDLLMDSGFWEPTPDASLAVSDEDAAVRLSRLPSRVRSILEQTRACLGDAATLDEAQAIQEINDLVSDAAPQRRKRSA